MRPPWLSALPRVAALVQCTVRRRRVSLLGLAIGVATLSVTLPIVQQLLDGTQLTLLGAPWVVSKASQVLLAYLCTTTGTLIIIGTLTEQDLSFLTSLFMAAGLLGAAVLLRSVLASLLLLCLPPVILARSSGREDPSAVRARASLMAWIGVPVLCIPTAIIVLERLAAQPESSLLATSSAWLVLLPSVVWLNLFPADSVVRPSSRDEMPLGSSFLWVSRDPVVVFLLLSLWLRFPQLHARTPLLAMGAVGFVTAVFNGVLAVAQSSASGLLACAALSSLGIAVQGLASGVQSGMLGGLTLLVSRSAAVLLAHTSLAAIRGLGSAGGERRPLREDWKMLLALSGFAVSVLTLAGAPWGALRARTAILAAVQPHSSFMLLAWACASVGLTLGLTRTLWRLWAEPTPTARDRVNDLLLVLVVGLVALTLGIGLRSQAVTQQLGEWLEGLLPAVNWVSRCATTLGLL